MGIGQGRQKAGVGCDRLGLAMDFNKYINTINYRQRVMSMLEEEARRLPAKQYSQFSAPLQQELDRLEGEIAWYEVLSTPTLVSYTLNCDSFNRLVEPKVKAFSNIWFNGAIHATCIAHKGPYVLSNQFLYQDAWEGPAQMVGCTRVAA